MATAHTCQISSKSEMVVRESVSKSDQLAWNGSIAKFVTLIQPHFQPRFVGLGLVVRE
jgi:hypothetical protein